MLLLQRPSLLAERLEPLHHLLHLIGRRRIRRTRLLQLLRLLRHRCGVRRFQRRYSLCLGALKLRRLLRQRTLQSRLVCRSLLRQRMLLRRLHRCLLLPKSSMLLLQLGCLFP